MLKDIFPFIVEWSSHEPQRLQAVERNLVNIVSYVHLAYTFVDTEKS